jgi:hypothetical protein
MQGCVQPCLPNCFSLESVRHGAYNESNSICWEEYTVDYITPKEASQKWGVSERRIQKLCEEGRIDGVVRFGKMWAIPKDAEKPTDRRKTKS